MQHQPNSERVVPSSAFVQQRRRELEAYFSSLLQATSSSSSSPSSFSSPSATGELWHHPLFLALFED
jgi:hypothetical protein